MTLLIVFILSLLLELSKPTNSHIPLERSPEWMLRVSGIDLQTGETRGFVIANTGIHCDRTFRISNAGYSLDLYLPESDLLPLPGDPERVDVVREIVATVGPVSIHNMDENRFEMILNSTEENFALNCVPESIFASPFGRGHSVGITITTTDSHAVSSREDFRIDYKVGDIGSVPFNIYQSIVGSLEANGAIQNADGVLINYHNCTVSQIPQFPSIEYLFDDGNRLIISAQDYLYFNSEYRTCALKVRPCSPIMGVTCAFHPLALSGTRQHY